MIENYDPNLRWARHTYAFTLQMWDYQLTLQADIGGNCRGFPTMEAALDSLVDKLFEEHGENPTLILTRPAEQPAHPGELDTLECSPDGDDLEDWLKKMCVAIDLVSHVEEKLR